MHGPILVHDRLDAAVARLAAVTAGGSSESHLPVWDRKPMERQTDEEMIAKLRTIQRRAPKRKRKR